MCTSRTPPHAIISVVWLFGSLSQSVARARHQMRLHSARMCLAFIFPIFFSVFLSLLVCVVECVRSHFQFSRIFFLSRSFVDIKCF